MTSLFCTPGVRPRHLTVTGVDDNIVDGNQKYRIITDACSSADATYDKVNPKDVHATNLDND